MNRSTLKFAGLFVAVLTCNEAAAWSHASGFGRTSGGGAHGVILVNLARLRAAMAVGVAKVIAAVRLRVVRVAGADQAIAVARRPVAKAAGAVRPRVAGQPLVARDPGTVLARKVERLRVEKVPGMPRGNMALQPAAITRMVMARPFTVRLSMVQMFIIRSRTGLPTIIRPPLSLPVVVATTVVITMGLIRQPRLQQVWWWGPLSRLRQTRVPTITLTEQAITRAWWLTPHRQCLWERHLSPFLQDVV